MKWAVVLVFLLVLASCGRVGFAPSESDGGLADELDASLDARPADAMTMPQSIARRISSASDDGEEAMDGTVDVDSRDIELCDDTTAGDLGQIIGLRFSNMAVPRNATITRAYLQFTVQNPATANAGSQTFRGQAAGAPPTFQLTTQNISLRPRTTAAVPWTPPLWDTDGLSGVDQQSPELAPIVQELVDRPDWASGNAMVFFVTGSGTNQAVAYDHVPAEAAELRIDFVP